MVGEIDTDQLAAVRRRAGAERACPVPLVVVQIVGVHRRDEESGQAQLVRFVLVEDAEIRLALVRACRSPPSRPGPDPRSHRRTDRSRRCRRHRSDGSPSSHAPFAFRSVEGSPVAVLVGIPVGFPAAAVEQAELRGVAQHVPQERIAERIADEHARHCCRAAHR